MFHDWIKKNNLVSSWYILVSNEPFSFEIGKAMQCIDNSLCFHFFLNSKFGKQYSIFKIQSIKLYLSFCGECDCLGKYIRIINNFIWCNITCNYVFFKVYIIAYYCFILKKNYDFFPFYFKKWPHCLSLEEYGQFLSIKWYFSIYPSRFFLISMKWQFLEDECKNIILQSKGMLPHWSKL